MNKLNKYLDIGIRLGLKLVVFSFICLLFALITYVAAKALWINNLGRLILVLVILGFGFYFLNKGKRL